VLEFLIIVLLDGREVDLNPRHIVSVAEAKDADDPAKHFTDKVKCVVSMVDGKFYATAETCDEIEQKLRAIAEKRIQEMRK
jgi:uncharacterized protein YlzI (FlbEa/FlbD family)